ncbi:thiamine/molybdopterin biosynthesis protein [Staphylococcus cohnii]|nr:thiamine/molybdopterin biosynthesis protein [Staphylococcus cohnii]
MMERYSRQIRYKNFGEQGQRKLAQTHVMIVGAGALGSHCAEILTRMGVGELTIIDMDIVELSNLHRQATYTENDAQTMMPKVEALKKHLLDINSNIKINTLYKEITCTNIEHILRKSNPDIVMDGMDHFKIRYLINEVCHKFSIPWIYGAAIGSQGTVYGIDYKGPCLKCVLDKMPESAESCSINGVLPTVIYQVASMEVSELLRWITASGFSQKLITLDTVSIQYHTVNINQLKNDDCSICVHQRYDLLNQPQHTNVESQCGNTFLLRFDENIFEYAHYLPAKIKKANSFAKLLSYNEINITLFKDGRMNVYGLEDEGQAQALYTHFAKSIK